MGHLVTLIALKIAIDLAGIFAAAIGLASSLVFRQAVLDSRIQPEHCRFPRVEHHQVEPDRTPDRQAAGSHVANGQLV